MTNQTTRLLSSNASLGLLLGVAIGGPALLRWATALPPWVGAATAGVGLFGALVVMSRQGALRARYIVFLACAVLVAASAAWLLR